MSFSDAVNKLKECSKLTKYQVKGALLEIATFYSLIDIGVYPIPLHNPYDDDYARDQHLGIDLIFRHDNKTYGVECKNLNHNCEWTKEWVNREVVKRFIYVQNIVPLDVKVLVTSYQPYNVPEDIWEIVIHRETNYDNINEVKLLLSKLFLSLFHQNKLNTSHISIHGYWRKGKGEYIKLKRIDEKLKKQYEIKGWDDRMIKEVDVE
jgi:hypothetical protein